MQFRTTGLLLLGAMALPASGTAQTTPAPPAITRTVVAATKLQTVTDAPLHFKAVSVTLQPDEKSDVSAANGILYQMSGSTEVSLGGEAKILNAGEALFIAGGETAALTAGVERPSTFLHFFILRTADLDRPVEAAPAAVRELFRTAAPIPCSLAVTISISPESHFRRRWPPTRRTIGRERRCTILFPASERTRSTARWKLGDQVP
jgi:quercetin dioxygenase-like cupin family protein